MTTLDELIDEVWPKEPPRSAVANLRTYAGNLRRLLAAHGAGPRLESRAAGYVLTVGDDELDLIQFERMLRDGRTALAGGRHAEAAGHLADGIALWRGQPLADVPVGPALAAACAALEEERTVAVEALAEARIALGEGAAVLATLREQVRTKPLRERGYELLMTARYQTGDVAAALATYTDARGVLVDRLGVEPGPRLRQLQGAVLRGDLAPAHAAAAAVTGGPARVPRELPPGAGSFTGRDRELAHLHAALAAPARQPGRPVVISAYGPGGAGKSALVIHFGHQVADRYPDGQVYIDLCGSTPDLMPRLPYEALVNCLRSIGVPGEQIPNEEAEAAARFRSATAGRRLLLVLDNAVDAGQVAPLLPAGEGCAVLLTSRQMLSTLDADLHLRVGGLAPTDAAALLGGLTGGKSVPTGEAERIARYCDHLPLALRIAGARLAARADLTAAGLADLLSDERGRLDELGIGSLAIRSSLRLSYRALAEEDLTAAAFRLLGTVRVPNIDARAVAAALRPVDGAAVRRALDRLIDAQLLESAPGGRYRLHDLVRLMAAEYAERDEPEPARREALHRVLLYYLESARRADDLLRPGQRPPAVDLLAPPDLRPAPLATPADAIAWFHTEVPTLLAIAEQTIGLPGEDGLFALRLAETIGIPLAKRGEFHAELRLAALALRAALVSNDPAHVASAHSRTGRALLHLDRLDDGVAELRRSLSIRRELGDVRGCISVLMDLAIAQDFARDHLAAVVSLRECLQLSRAAGLRDFTGVVLANLVSAYIELNRWAEATETVEESLAIRRELGDRAGEAATLVLHGQILALVGELTPALAVLNQAVTACRETGNRVDEWNGLALRTEVQLRLGAVPEAVEDAYDAATIAAVGDDPYPRAASMRQLAKVLRASGEEADAADFTRHAAILFQRLPPPRSRALERLLIG